MLISIPSDSKAKKEASKHGDLFHEALNPAAQPQYFAFVDGCLGHIPGRPDETQVFGRMNFYLFFQIDQLRDKLLLLHGDSDLSKNNVKGKAKLEGYLSRFTDSFAWAINIERFHAHSRDRLVSEKLKSF
jgi:hypothetical protein